MVNQEDLRLYKELKRSYIHKRLLFKKPAKTSRDTLHYRDTWYIILTDKLGRNGIGECAPIDGLSVETGREVEEILSRWVLSDDKVENEKLLHSTSSVRFGLETALKDIKNGGLRTIFEIPSSPLPINGLVWMNEKHSMMEEAIKKIADGYRCIKLKIGGILFEDELDILREIRNNFPSKNIEIRLDANGAFSAEEALKKLEILSQFDIHSIEQPIKAGQWKEMKKIASASPVPIALDEELIGIADQDKEQLLDTILPHYIILKPTLHGGFAGCDKWISLSEKRNISWWATSALESNIGLNAIAQWVWQKRPSMAQGLGTGSLYESNIPSPIEVNKGILTYSDVKGWDVSAILAS